MPHLCVMQLLGGQLFLLLLVVQHMHHKLLDLEQAAAQVGAHHVLDPVELLHVDGAHQLAISPPDLQVADHLLLQDITPLT